MVEVTFWGVRGSVPSPLTGGLVEKKLKDLFQEFLKTGRSDWEVFYAELPFWKRSTYGGNTSCVELTVGGKRIIFDLGTGVRELGSALLKEMFAKGGLDTEIFLSHVHWDHIQGIPYFPPLYINKYLTGINNKMHFYGGTNWMKPVGECLEAQMTTPSFPITWEYIKKITGELKTNDVFDGLKFSVGEAEVTVRQLDHPQETYGYRVDYKGIATVYATDNEPRNPLHPDPALLSLAKGADLLIIDCQYTQDIYEGKVGGVCRQRWGHSYPEAIAQVAVQAKVKKMALFHHDPNSTDEAIHQIGAYVQKLVRELGGSTEVVAAYEGLKIIF